MTSPLDASPDPLITLEPTRRVTLREAFGIDSDMTVPAFDERDSHVPEIDEAYQNELWGEDAEGVAKRKLRTGDIELAARFLMLLRTSTAGIQ